MTRRRNDRKSFTGVKLFLPTCHLVCEYFRCLLKALSHHKGFDLAHDIKKNSSQLHQFDKTQTSR